ncbi:hypothetical protein VD0002_g6705 [Verticillium dahliae]|uniref:Uncharacterized protein n=1 Tax=Verticillium dahliae TaxID=27337 RepID=A0AA44WMR4_VERDA|nr:hypothetical protein BJF96_g4550 [Verticillium dahliae]PNH56260.1 hypothetical protein VD0003_g1424 [Verticillium dahliae]PNH61025.1 hypothetical protein VD0002_g6705 [Verticillium dahliae]
MATDLASPVGLAHPDEAEYIDYSDDEPDTSPIKPNADSTSYFESAKPAVETSESAHGDSAGVAELLAEDLHDAPDVATTGAESLPQSDAVLADGIQHNDPDSVAQAAHTAEDGLVENEISWEGEQHDEQDESMQQDDALAAQDQQYQEDAEQYHAIADGQLANTFTDAQSHIAQDQGAETASAIDGAVSALDQSVQENGDLNEIDYEDDGGMTAETTERDLEGQHADEELEHETEENVALAQEVPEPSSVEEDASHEALLDDEEEGHEDESGADPSTNAEALIADSSAASLDTPGEEDAQMPVVTVSWHGVEYPMFYNSVGSEGRDCFFHDLSVLQCKMEELLASLRRVLVDDVAESEELVLQVEELGLEFAESSHPDHFSEITLGSILQVFDHLVKNKDPEATRPMYALLITRPNCSKRWSSLIEDAWNGKNIDEVSYSFHSRDQEAIEEAEVEAEDAEMFLNQDDLDDDMGGDFDDLVEQDNEADHELPDSADEGRDDPELTNDADEGTTTLDANELDLTVDAADDVAALQESEQIAPLETDTLTSVTAVDEADIDAGAADASMLDDVAALGELDTVPDPDATVLAELDEPVTTAAVLEDVNASIQMPEAIDGDGQQATELNAPLLSDGFNPLLAAEASNNDLNEQQQTTGYADNDEQLDLDPDETGVDLSVVNQGTPVTSATATLDGDEVDDLGAEIDLTADIPQDGETINGNSEHGPNDLEEIDWRDFPGDGDDEVSHESTSVSGKRPRTDEDDLLGAEDEQDAKRLRS